METNFSEYYNQFQNILAAAKKKYGTSVKGMTAEQAASYTAALGILSRTLNKLADDLNV